MADQGKWFKLWCSSLDDQDLENLNIHEWFGWARFGTYVKRHGKGGKIRLREPATAVVNVMRVETFKDAINMIKKFPNYHVEETKKDPSNETANVTVEHRYTVSVKCRNWQKYQGDFSTERVKSYRVKNRQVETVNVTAQEEKRSRRDVEEKRRDVVSPQPPKNFSRPTPEEVTAYAKSIGFDLKGSRFCDHYDSNGWRVGRTPMKDWQAAIRTWKRKHEEDNPHAPHGSQGVSEYADIAERARQSAGLRKIGESSERSVLARFRDLPDVPPKDEPGS